MSLCLKFEKYPIIGCWDIQIFMFWGHRPLEVVFHWRSSSLKPFETLVWSHELMFKIWRRSYQWLLKYSDFHILMSSSIRGRLPLKVVFIETFFLLWFGPMSLYLKFEEDPICGCWDIQIFIFLGHLPLEVIFHWRSSSLQRFFTLLWSHELLFKNLGRSGQWLLRY